MVDNMQARFLTDESIFEGGDLEAKTYVFRYYIGKYMCTILYKYTY